MSGTIRLHRTYRATAEELWDLIATRDGLAAWLMPNDFEPVVGHRFTFTDTPRPPLYDGMVACTVLEVVAPRRLRMSWVGGPIDTVVTFTLTPLDQESVRLDLEHTGFSGVRPSLVRAVLNLGWRSLLRRRLPDAIDRHRTRQGG